jgi:hypothetical protein
VSLENSVALSAIAKFTAWEIGESGQEQWRSLRGTEAEAGRHWLILVLASRRISRWLPSLLSWFRRRTVPERPYLVLVNTSMLSCVIRRLRRPCPCTSS